MPRWVINGWTLSGSSISSSNEVSSSGDASFQVLVDLRLLEVLVLVAIVFFFMLLSFPCVSSSAISFPSFWFFIVTIPSSFSSADSTSCSFLASAFDD
ncbi:Uncharacterized protein TCM_009952 [Theobroma cacao]|uniref:Uncharacterized protein n=1 Tax=Theobroma cacao TaxID=3641 RepID=A0A061E789_THECC|nr:Uncharacterized protein TCM_009952 [Theobroma cacao]